MWNRNPNPILAITTACILATTALFALQGEARSSLCREYETTVLIPPNRAVKAIGKVCQANGKWYLASFEPGELGR